MRLFYCLKATRALRRNKAVASPPWNIACLKIRAKQRARPEARALGNPERPRLLDLGFLELDVLARDRVVLGLGHLFRHRAAVLLRYVEETGVSRREQLDLDGRCFRHGRSAFS